MAWHYSCYLFQQHSCFLISLATGHINFTEVRIIETFLERRREPRIPLQMNFRLRESLSNLSYSALSDNLHSGGVQIETEAPLTADMDVELWPEESAVANHYVGGKVCWIKPSPCGNKNTYGIELTRPINWPISLKNLTKTTDFFNQIKSTDPSKFILDSVLDGVFSVDNK